jgi:hypothetical protein
MGQKSGVEHGTLRMEGTCPFECEDVKGGQAFHTIMASDTRRAINGMRT